MLLERESALETLAQSIADAASGAGRLVLVGGEAGTGKTSLVRAAVGWTDVEVLWGNCDDLLTPRPLGPLLDALGTREGASREVVSRALLERLSERPTLLVIEDAHWADGASIDLLQYLARRIGRTRSVLVITYRDEAKDAFGGQSPLRALLGQVGHGPRVRRIRLNPLSRTAVRELAAGAEADPDEVFRLSGGNPYVVSELLADPGGAVHSVGDAIRARSAQLPVSGLRVLEAAAVMSEGAEPSVLARLASGAEGMDACVAAGLLVPDGDRVRFRHELARSAVEQALTPGRRAELHASVLAALLASGTAEPARCAHHADQAGDREQVLRFAGPAADRAIALGSHREGAAQLERALRFVGNEPQQRATLLDRIGEQYLYLDRTADAKRANDEALALRRAAGDQVALAGCLRRRAEILSYCADPSGALEAARAAVDLLVPLGEQPELGRAYARLAQLLMLREQMPEAVSAARRAEGIAERFGDHETRVHALTTWGSALALAGDESGLELLEKSIVRGQAIGLEAECVRARNNLITLRLAHDRVEGLRELIQESTDYAAERGLEVHAQCTRWALAQLLLKLGDWGKAGEMARRVATTEGTSNRQRIEPLILLGTLRARRGDPDHDAPLEEGLALALRTGEPQLIYPAHRALAESAWLAGDPERAARHATAARAALQHSPGHPNRAEADYWCWRAGVKIEDAGEDVGPSAHPYRLQIAGQTQPAAARWRDLGFPYHEADALADSVDPDDLRRAWVLFDQLGVTARTVEIENRLGVRGARNLPRRLRAGSRANPAGLTDRQLEIAGLIAGHLTNQEIAQRLYLSPRTVDHHVSAILGKLEVGTRRHAAQRCLELGIAVG